MPDNATEIYFKAAFHKQWSSAGSSWLNRDGSAGHYLSHDQRPEEIEDSVEFLLEELKGLDMFSSSPWNHAKVVLSEVGKINIHFAYVDDDDSFPNLHMRGVSELSYKDFYKDHPFPLSDWIEKVERVEARKVVELEKLDPIKDAVLFSKLDNQLKFIRSNVIEAKKSLLSH